MSLRQIKIKTITPRYDILEDRIRLSLNHNDIQNQIDFMLTRKFILNLLPSYEEYMLKVYNKEMQEKKYNNQKKQQGARLDNHNNLEPYQHNAELLLSIQFSFIPKDKLTILKFSTTHTEAIATLNLQDLINVFSLIKSTIPYFDWSVSPHF